MYAADRFDDLYDALGTAGRLADWMSLPVLILTALSTMTGGGGKVRRSWPMVDFHSSRHRLRTEQPNHMYLSGSPLTCCFTFAPQSHSHFVACRSQCLPQLNDQRSTWEPKEEGRRTDLLYSIELLYLIANTTLKKGFSPGSPTFRSTGAVLRPAGRSVEGRTCRADRRGSTADEEV